jgi:hypothetical protein
LTCERIQWIELTSQKRLRHRGRPRLLEEFITTMRRLKNSPHGGEISIDDGC